ncbi:H-NS histone family protein [Thiohalocapsa marina]|uniref:H-NS histone family protein n=1 Tax=Thiohalocapsa marina TaxID=424902 RepID=A0A5M8FD50_9GAMM|nr:H-NS family nucleoid-associated regulatory protein [Thiohalocapsa marina]KAA6182597.1 H-NS histone family protein [Thiohalocapsa marina]
MDADQYAGTLTDAVRFLSTPCQQMHYTPAFDHNTRELSMDSFEHLDIDELQRHQQEMAQKQVEIERLLKVKLKEAKGDFVRELRAQIEARGYEVSDIASQLLGRKRGGGAEPTGSYYVDPDDPSNTYKRGPVPQWLKNKMLAQGFDPTDREQRDAFKAEHLNLVVG